MKYICMIVCWNWITLCTNSHDHLTCLLLGGFEFWSAGNHGNRQIFMFPYSIFRNVEKLDIMLFDFSFGELYEIESIKTPLFDIMNTYLYSKSYKIRMIWNTRMLTSRHCCNASLGHQNSITPQETHELLWYLVCV